MYNNYEWGGLFKYPQYDNTIRDDLVHIEFGYGGDEITVSFGLRYWNPHNALNSALDTLIEDADLFTNNLQQFLYNFRTYIINRLYNYKGGTKHIITLHTNVYNIVLGLDESGYANTFHMPDEPSIDYVTSLNQKLTDINWGLAYV